MATGYAATRSSRRGSFRFPCLLLFTLSLALLTPRTGSPATFAGGMTQLASITPQGGPANLVSANPALSFDGRYVAFDSRASNLVPHDTNNVLDVFVRDMQTGVTERVSVTSAGAQANGPSYDPAISNDGRYVIFTSEALNLDGATRGMMGKPYRGPGINVFLHDRQTGATMPVSVDNRGIAADGHAWLGDISAEGNYVTFSSHSDTLVKPDLNGIKRDPFIRDRVLQLTEFVDLLPNGKNPWSGGSFASVSANGWRVAYRSLANNLVPGDTNSRFDIFVLDRGSHATRRVSLTSAGQQGTADAQYPDISANGRFVAFDTASALVASDGNARIDVYVHDMDTGQTALASLSSAGLVADGLSEKASISDDGRYVSFVSAAANLVADDTNGVTDIFVHDRQTGDTARVSLTEGGGQATGASTWPSLSGDGRYVAFVSSARNLVGGIVTTVPQVYVRALSPEPTYAIAGVVRSDDGAPLAGVRVAAGAGMAAETDSEGRYHLTDVRPGTYTIAAAKAGYNFAPALREVSVPPDATGENFTGTALPTYTISGTVQTTEGAPLANVTVADQAGHSALTNADGIYTLPDLPSGAYTIVPTKTGYTFEPASQTIETPPDAIGVDFAASVQPLYSISGTVQTTEGAPLANVSVADQAGHSALTNADGVYTLPDLPSGTYTIAPTRTGYAFEPASQTLETPPDATAVDFAARAQALYSISGIVRRADGTGIQNATVSDNFGHTTSTNYRGQYTLSGLTAGTYTITATKGVMNFAPDSIVVTLPPNATRKNFTKR